MTTRSHRRNGRSSGPQPIPAKPEVPMQQPPPPPVPMTDAALAVIWEKHAHEMGEAVRYGKQAEPHEAAAKERRTSAHQKREEADRKRVEAQRLDEQAAELEALANADAHRAELLRQDQEHHEDNASKVALTVQFLSQTNGLLHPAERQQRAEQAAAANGKLVADQSAGVNETQPFPSPREAAL